MWPSLKRTGSSHSGLLQPIFPCLAIQHAHVQTFEGWLTGRYFDLLCPRFFCFVFRNLAGLGSSSVIPYSLGSRDVALISSVLLLQSSVEESQLLWISMEANLALFDTESAVFSLSLSRWLMPAVTYVAGSQEWKKNLTLRRKWCGACCRIVQAHRLFVP